MKCISFLLLVISISCGKNVVERSPFNPPSPEEKTIISKNKVIEIKQTELSGLEKWKNEQLEMVSYERIDIPGNYNFELYQSKKEEDKGKVYLLPKLKLLPSFGSLYRMKRTQFGDDLEKIEIPVIFVSGLLDNIFSQDHSEQVNLSKDWLLKDQDLLREMLSEKLGNSITFHPLSGCTDWIKLKSSSGVFEGNLEPFYTEECALDKPMKLTFVMPQEKAQKLIEQDLYLDRGADIEILYNAGMNIKSGSYTIKINLEKLHTQLEKKLKEKNYWEPSQANTKLYELLCNELLTIGMAKKLDIPLKKISQDLERFVFVSSDEGSELNYAINNEEIYTYELKKIEKRLSDEKYSLKLAIRDQTPFTETYSIETGSTTPVSFLIGIGDFIEIKINNVFDWKKRQLKNEIQANNNVCVESKKQCRSYEILESGNRTCNYSKNVCVRSENQWIHHTDYSYKDGEFIKMEQWPLKIDDIINGLELTFKKDDVQFSCSLKSFSPQLQENTLMFRIEDSQECSISKPGLKDYSVSVKSNLKFPHQYKQGRLSVNWHGKLLSQEQDITLVEPTKIDFAVRVRSYNVGSK